MPGALRFFRLVLTRKLCKERKAQGSLRSLLFKTGSFPLFLLSLPHPFRLRRGVEHQTIGLHVKQNHITR